MKNSAPLICGSLGLLLAVVAVPAFGAQPPAPSAETAGGPQPAEVAAPAEGGTTPPSDAREDAADTAGDSSAAVDAAGNPSEPVDATSAGAGESAKQPATQQVTPTTEVTATGDATSLQLGAERQAAVSEVVEGRTHDGLYLRISSGPSAAHVELTDAPRGVGDITEGGGTVDLRLGGTPARGFVVGGGLWLSGYDTDEWRGEDSRRGGVGVVALGPFVDYFPDPHEGLHFGGMLGVAALGLDVEDISKQERLAGGGALGAWVGYDFWLGPEWSLGVELDYMSVRGRNDDHDWEGSADIVGVSLTGLYH